MALSGASMGARAGGFGPGLVLALVLAIRFAALHPASAVAADPAASSPRVTAVLVSEAAVIVPGTPFWVGLSQRIAPGWHTYWENPGDSGEPATIEWSLPPGFEAEGIVWPHPRRIPVGPFVSYGYEREVLLLTRIKPPASLAVGTDVSVRAHAGWLVCAKECIPEEASLAVTLPVGTAPRPDGRWSEAFARARRAVPVPSPWAADFTASGDDLVLSVAARGVGTEQLAGAWFYPREWGVIDHAARQRVSASPAGIRIAVARGPLLEKQRQPIEGVLVLEDGPGSAGAGRAFSLRARPVPVAAPGGTSAAVLGSPIPAVALAFLGGLILNLMPCVLPVLSVKVLALIDQSKASPGEGRRHGLAYTLGVLAAFTVVAGALLAARRAGEEVGWGFQLQSPVFVTFLAYLFFAMGLGLSGVVTLGRSLGGVGHGLASRPGYAGSLFTGALAAVAATPCTAPFMGAAVGLAVTQPVPVAIAVFQALALGLALPYLALALFPAWRRIVPRPGPWMERLKQLMAFPLYASAAWLIWVLSQQAGPTGVATVLAGLIAIGFAAWLGEVSRAAAPRWRRAAVGLALLALAGAVTGAGIGLSVGSGQSAVEVARSPEEFSPARVEALRAQGRPVFVNFTAAWCITCLVNDRVALRSPAVADAFARKRVAYLTADWTRRDPEITRTLGAFGRNGVPLYLLYPPAAEGPPGVEPAVLPAVLTPGIVLDAVERLPAPPASRKETS